MIFHSKQIKYAPYSFQDNERLVHRIQQVYKYTRQVRKERKFLMDRLDNYGDNWRQGITQYIHDDGLSHLRNISKQKVSIIFHILFL